MSTAAAAVEVKPTEPKYALQSKLSVVYFHGSVSFFGSSEMNSASVGNLGSNTVDSILPGRMSDDGGIVLGADGATGLVLRKRLHDLHTNKRKLSQAWVPWANVKSVGYGE